jgi:NTE family protein
MLSRPDVLVLGAGGVLGEAWITGVLAGIEDATGFDMRDCEHFVGTSAGSIVAAHLVAGEPLRRPGATSTELEVATPPAAVGLAAAALTAARRAGAWALAASSSFAPLALGLAAPGGALLRATLLRSLPRPRDTLDDLERQVDRSRARFDGRLRVTTVERTSGRRVVFGSPGSPFASVAQAVAASCTIPWMFAPVAINGHEYVDGGVWSPTNMDAAPVGLDTQVLCLSPTAGILGDDRLVSIVRRVAQSATVIESLALRRRGAQVRTVAPNVQSASAMGNNFMDRARRQSALAAGYRQGLSAARGS